MRFFSFISTSTCAMRPEFLTNNLTTQKGVQRGTATRKSLAGKISAGGTPRTG
jgi:hypothetical protein